MRGEAARAGRQDRRLDLARRAGAAEPGSDHASVGAGREVGVLLRRAPGRRRSARVQSRRRPGAWRSGPRGPRARCCRGCASTPRSRCPAASIASAGCSPDAFAAVDERVWPVAAKTPFGAARVGLDEVAAAGGDEGRPGHHCASVRRDGDVRGRRAVRRVEVAGRVGDRLRYPEQAAGAVADRGLQHPAADTCPPGTPRPRSRLRRRRPPARPRRPSTRASGAARSRRRRRRARATRMRRSGGQILFPRDGRVAPAVHRDLRRGRAVARSPTASSARRSLPGRPASHRLDDDARPSPAAPRRDGRPVGRDGDGHFRLVSPSPVERRGRQPVRRRVRRRRRAARPAAAQRGSARVST